MVLKNIYSRFNIFCVSVCYLFSSVRGAIEITSCEGNTLCAKERCSKELNIDITNYCITKNVIYGFNSDNTEGCYYEYLDRGFNAVKLNGSEVLSFTSVNEYNSTDVSYMALVNCDYNNNCKQTTGIIKNVDSEYYNIYSSKDKSNGKASILNSCVSNVGGVSKINNQVVLCFSSKSYVSLSSYGAYYLVEGSVVSGSPFTVDSGNKNAVVRVDNESFIYSNYFSGTSFYLNSSNSKLIKNIKSILSNNENNSIAKKIYYCNNGSCTSFAIDIDEGVYMIYDSLYSITISDGNIVFNKVVKNGIMAFKSYSNNYMPDITNVLVKDSELNGDLTEDVSNIKLYDCMLGSCIKTNGYIKVNGKDDEGKPLVKVFMCDDDSCGTEQKSVTCEKKNVGVADYDSEKTEYKICINSGTTSDTYAYKVITSGTTMQFYYSRSENNIYNLYISDKTGNIAGLSHRSAIFGREKTVEENAPKEYELMYCIGNSNSNSPSKCSVNDKLYGYFLNYGDEDSSNLIYCDENSKTCKIEKKDGYFINNLDQYIIKCESSLCNLTEGSSCENNNNEAISYYDSNLEADKFVYCHGSKEIQFLETDKYYPLSNVKASLKYPIINSGDETILIKVDKYSATQYTDQNYVCITSDNSLDEFCNVSGTKVYTCLTTITGCSVINNNCDVEKEKGGCAGYYLSNNALYECVNTIVDNKSVPKCSSKQNIKGYFKVTDIFASKSTPYILCNDSGCKGINAPTKSVTKCNSPGELVLNSSKVKICINNSSMVGFSDNDEVTSYMIENNENSNLSYNGNANALITVTKDSIISSDLTKIESGIYIIGDVTYKFDKDDKSQLTIEKIKTDRISVFRFENNNGYGKLVSDDEDFSNIGNEIRLYDCMNSKCTRTTGYIKLSSNEIRKCTLKNCEDKQEKISCSIKSCTGVNCNDDYIYGNVGIGYYDSDFKICLLDNNKSFKTVSLKKGESESYNMSFTGKSNLICTQSLQIYNLYISNALGNIVILSVQDGYYLFEENTQLLKCSRNPYGSECYRSSGPGYYINSASKKSNDLIYCDGSVCTTKSQDNGYFINSEYEAIICGSSECEIFDKGRECKVNSDEVILNSSGFLNYCRDVNEIEFLNVDQYYPLPNIDAKNSIYPKVIKAGSDVILLKIGKYYSVTQYVATEENSVICIDKNNVEDVGCLISGATKYTCSSSNEGCKAEVNECDPVNSIGSCSGYYLAGVDKTSGSGTLYECVYNAELGNSTCTDQPNTTRGYFKVTDAYEKEKVPYIECNGSSCKKLEVPTKSVEKCESENFGKLVLDSTTSEVKLCADSYNMVGFSTDGTSTKRIINANYDNSVFIDKRSYVLVSINYNSMKPTNYDLIDSNTYLFNDEIYSFKKEGSGNETTINIEKLPLSGMMAFTFNDVDLGVLINDDDFSNDLSKVLISTNLYECRNGLCVSTIGYLKYKTDKVVQCNGYNCNNEQSSISYCEYSYSGIAYYDTYQKKYLMCLQYRKYNYYYSNYYYYSTLYNSYEIKKGSNVQYMFVEKSNSLYITDKGGNVVGKSIREGYFLNDPEGDEVGDIVRCKSTSYDDEGKNVKCNYIYESYNNNNCNGYYINAGSSASNELIYCYNYSCEISREEYGYFVNEYQFRMTEEYVGIKCVDSTCTLFKVGKSCYKHENGIVYNNYGNFKYCNGHEELYMDGTRYHPLSDVNAGSTFYPQVDSGNDIILVKTDQYSLKQYTTSYKGICLSESYESSCNTGKTRYICTDERKGCKVSIITCDPTAETPDSKCSGYYLVKDENEDKNILYLCDLDDNSDVRCTAQPDSTRGYFKVTDVYENINYQYIKCDGSKCEKLLTKNLNSKCNNVGDLILSKYVYFCINDSKSIEFGNYGNVVVNFGTKENIFTDETNKNLVISITNKHIIPTDLSELPTNIYLIGSYIYLFINEENGKYNIEKLNTTGALAFRCYYESIFKEINGVLIKNEEYLGPISTDYLSTIRTYQCIKGLCTSSLGYINYDTNKVYRCYNGSNTFVSSKTCNYDYIGYGFYDSGFKLCIRNNVNESYVYKHIAITSGTTMNYIATLQYSSNNDIYNIYITDKSGNVVVRNIQSGYYVYDFNGNGNMSLLSCINETCYKDKYEGYFINSASEKSNSLIYCKSKGSCEIVTENNGYFTNSEGYAIKCTSSVCSIYSYASTTSCIGHQYEVIKNDYSEFEFCKGTDRVEFGSRYDPKYYPISVDAGSSVFPKYANGTDTILLITDKYSISQHLTNSNGIYVNYNDYEDINGNSSGSTKYVCTDASKGCVVTPNICDPKTSTGGCEGFYLNGGLVYECKVSCRDNKDVECKPRPSSTRGYFHVTDYFHKKQVEYIKCDGSLCARMELPAMHKVNDEDYNDEDFDNYPYEDFDDYRCNKGNIGKLIYYRNVEINVCLNSRINFGFSDTPDSTERGRGIISVDSSSNVFAKSSSDKYVMVAVSSNHVELIDISSVPSNTYLLYDEDEELGPYRLQNNGNGEVIIEKIYTSQLMAFREVSDAPISEFYRVLVTDDDYKSDLTKELSNIRLYDCHFGECKETTGYLKHNTNNSTDIKVTRCDYSCEKETITNVKISPCNSNSNSEIVEKAYYNEETSKFMICVKANSSKYKEKTVNIDSVKANHIFNYKVSSSSSSSSTSYYNLYISDYGGNIIGKSVMNGYYLSKVFGDSINMVKCSNSYYNNEVECNIMNNGNGYYLNHGILDSKNLIYCYEGNCNSIVSNSGYYINKNSEVTECDSSQCIPFSPDYIQSCKSNVNEIISTRYGYKYCNNNTLVQMNSEAQYYPLSDISADEDTYPVSVSSGDDTILIRVDRYSASQYLTTGICVNDDNTQDYTCKFTGPTLYICNNSTESCKYGPLSENAETEGYDLSDFSLLKDKDDAALRNIPMNMLSYAIKTFIISMVLALMFL